MSGQRSSFATSRVGRKRRSPWVWVAAAVAAVIVILAAVLGGVLGSRATSGDNKNNSVGAKVNAGAASGGEPSRSFFAPGVPLACSWRAPGEPLAHHWPTTGVPWARRPHCVSVHDSRSMLTMICDSLYDRYRQCGEHIASSRRFQGCNHRLAGLELGPEQVYRHVLRQYVHP